MFVAADLPVKMCDWQDRINLSNVRQVCKDKNKSTATKLSPVFPSATCAAKEAEVKANRRCHVTRTISTVQITLRLKLFLCIFSAPANIGRCTNRRPASLRKFDFVAAKLPNAVVAVAKCKAVTAESFFPAASLFSARNVHFKTATFCSCSHGTVEAKVSDSVCVCRFPVIH